MKKRCFICLDDIDENENENENENEKNVYKSHDNFSCKCKYICHDSCIQKWFFMNNKCPICKNNKNNIIYTEHHDDPFNDLEFTIKDFNIITLIISLFQS